MTTWQEYTDFVQACTSSESEFLDDLVMVLSDLEEVTNPALLLTGAMGLSSESGEFTEIVKKMLFQGKDIDRRHLIRELGDILWYWTNACRALSVTPEEVMKENIDKLIARYPSGEFDSFFSENRSDTDL
jgi:NTP pyrophosphatase (non-canonical NTP hydrolase)